MSSIFPYETNQKAKFPCRVSFVKVLGLKHTKPTVIQKLFSPVFDAKNLQELDTAIQKGLISTSELDLIKDVDIDLDINDSNDVLVVLTMKEKGRRFFNIGGSISTRGEAEGNVSLGYRNVIGLADRFKLSLGYSGGKNISLSSTIEVPNVLGKLSFISSEFFTKKTFAGSDGLEKFVSGVQFGSRLDDDNTVTIGVENRNIGEKSMLKELELRSLVKMNTMLGYVSHTYTKDLRNSTTNPTGGFFFRVQNMISESLLFGYSSFLKSECKFGMYKLFDEFLTGSIEVNVGGIVPFGKDKFVDLSEKICTKVRGFALNKYRGNYSYSILGRLGVPLKFLGEFYKATNVQFCALVNAGSDVDKIRKFADVYSGINVTCGLGLAFLLNVGRVELNYCHPITKRNLDNYKKFDVHFSCDI